jgi:hypothetical protein
MVHIAAVPSSVGPRRVQTEADRHLLLRPPHCRRPHQYRQRYIRRLPAVENRLDDIGRQQRQPQDAADVGGIDLLCGGDLLDGREHAAFGAVANGSFRVTRPFPTVAWRGKIDPQATFAGCESTA